MKIRSRTTNIAGKRTELIDVYIRCLKLLIKEKKITETSWNCDGIRHININISMTFCDTSYIRAFQSLIYITYLLTSLYTKGLSALKYPATAFHCPYLPSVLHWNDYDWGRFNARFNFAWLSKRHQSHKTLTTCQPELCVMDVTMCQTKVCKWEDHELARKNININLVAPTRSSHITDVEMQINCSTWLHVQSINQYVNQPVSRSDWFKVKVS